jgi:SAM-dependent methyltransferase
MPPAPEKEFSIKDDWTSRLVLPAAAAGTLFGGAFFLILPLAMPAALKTAVSLLLGTAAAAFTIYRLKRGHYLRHAAEAVFLGFRCRPGRPLWDPFTPLEILLGGGSGDPEEDRLMAGLVRMHGPEYRRRRGKPGRLAEASVALAVLLAVMITRFPRTLPVLYPLFGLTVLSFLLVKWERLLGHLETTGSISERGLPSAPRTAYIRWNFLALEAQRELAGRLPAMRTAIARVLLEEAGLKPGDAVLETGSAGGFLWKQVPPGLRPNWTQLEKDPYSSLYARKHGNGSAFVLADAGALPFPDASFDAVTGLECFDSLTPADLELFLREALRVLKPGGRLIHLKDFPDWPGGPLAEELNAFSMRVLRRELLTLRSNLVFSYEELDEKEIRELGGAAAREEGRAGRAAGVLAGIYAAGTGSDPRFSVPMFVSAMILAREFPAAGFEPGRDSFSLPPGRESALAYVVARKPG